MRLRMSPFAWGLLMGAVIALPLWGQTGNRTTLTASVSFLSGSSIYLDGGRAAGFEVGDTLTITRTRDTVCTAVIVAISSSSSSAKVLAQNLQPLVGDRASTIKAAPSQDARSAPRISEPSLPNPAPTANSVSGYVALSYAATTWGENSIAVSQPGAALRFTVSRLAGTDLSFSMYGRSSYNLAGPSSRLHSASGVDTRVYEAALTYESPSRWYGFSLGRVSSKYVAGMGLFDGAQASFRMGRFRVGAFGGWQAENSMSSFGTKKQKVGGFVSYAWGNEIFSSSEITLAYGKSMVKGRLDRDYLYLQSRVRLTSSLFFYQNTELDMHRMEGGVPVSKVGFTNTYVSIACYPMAWLNVTAGYDATRAIYLFESMKLVSDTLVDQSLKQGFRGSISVRLPLQTVANAMGTVRPSSGANPEAHTMGGGLRIADIANTGISVGGQYTKIGSSYTDGEDITVDIAWWMTEQLSGSLRVDRYHYRALGESEPLRTVTASVNVSYRLSRSLYVLAFVDNVWDSLQNMRRVYLECGLHF